MLWVWRKAQGYGAVSALTGRGRDALYGQATIVDRPDRARQLTANGCAGTVLHGGAEIGTLPIDYGAGSARGGVRLHKYVDSTARGAHRVCCMSEYIYQR